MSIIERVPENCVIPKWYGVAWYEWAGRHWVCLPIPLNMAAALLRSAYVFFRGGFRAMPIDPRDAYLQGVRDGEKKGRACS